MKEKWIIVLCFSLPLWPLFGQDQVNSFIKEAQEFYAQKNYKQAQMSLQDAINELNNLISAQLVTVLPEEINGLKAEEGGTSNANFTALGGGTQISKRYQNPSKKENDAEIQIIANSPMMSAMTMYMSNPSLMGDGAKSVRVGTQRALMARWRDRSRRGCPPEVTAGPSSTSATTGRWPGGPWPHPVRRRPA